MVYSVQCSQKQRSTQTVGLYTQKCSTVYAHSYRHVPYIQLCLLCEGCTHYLLTMANSYLHKLYVIHAVSDLQFNVMTSPPCCSSLDAGNKTNPSHTFWQHISAIFRVVSYLQLEAVIVYTTTLTQLQYNLAL